MRESHFIVSTVEGVMLTACGKAISPKAAAGATVGRQAGAIFCSECDDIVVRAWITLAGGA